MGFFDLSDRYPSLDAKKNPLVEIDSIVPWEEFRLALQRVWHKPDADRKFCSARQADGRGADVQDAGAERALQSAGSPDRVSGSRAAGVYLAPGKALRSNVPEGRLLGHGLGDRAPDAKTVWLYRDALAQAGKVEELFGLFDGYLARQRYIAWGGQILDASIVPGPRNHNTRDENATIKKGEVPGDWAAKPAKRVQKDVDARWSEEDQKTVRGTVFPTNKHGKAPLRLQEPRECGPHAQAGELPSPHRRDSQTVDQLLMQGNTGYGVWAVQKGDCKAICRERP